MSGVYEAVLMVCSLDIPQNATSSHPALEHVQEANSVLGGDPSAGAQRDCNFAFCVPQ